MKIKSVNEMKEGVGSSYQVHNIPWLTSKISYNYLWWGPIRIFISVQLYNVLR